MSNTKGISPETRTLMEYSVVKRNDLIQRSRYHLTTQEQKIVLYLISKIKPEDDDLKLYEFKIKDFCEVCGIDETSGRNYEALKNTVKNLTDKSVWIMLDDGSETVARWIERPYINKKSGIIRIKLDEFMKPYLLEMKKHFTAYSLYFTLAMKSKYSLRIYELLKSFQNMGQYELEIEQLKKKLFAVKYERHQDFRIKVLEVAVQEINAYSDISVTYELKKQGRKYEKIKFYMRLKIDLDQRMETFKNIEKRLNKANRG